MAYAQIKKHDSPNFTPSARANAVFGMPRTVDGITIHHWGSLGQKFENVVKYLCRKGGNTSAHEVIEAGRVAIIVNHKDVAWHSGNAKGNCSTIGLELRPEMSDDDFETAAERIADLRDFYGKNLPLIPHVSWKATACPGKWYAQLDRLSDRAEEIRKGVKPAAKPVKKPTAPAYTTVKYGSRNATVGRVQRALRDKQYTKQIVDNHYGVQTRANVQDFQKRTGLYVDGIAGPITQKRLGI